MSHPVNGIKERQLRQCIVSVTMCLHTMSPLENEKYYHSNFTILCLTLILLHVQQGIKDLGLFRA